MRNCLNTLSVTGKAGVLADSVGKVQTAQNVQSDL